MAAGRILDAAETGHDLAEVRRTAELQRLGRHVAHEIFREHLRKARDVENEFLRIQRHELAAQALAGIDELGRCAAHTGVKGGE